MKKSISIILAVLVVLSSFTLLSTVAFAADVASGTCGDNATWRLTEKGTLIINGSGAMYDYKFPKDNNDSTGIAAPWQRYKDDIKSIKVNEGITYIGTYNFLNTAATKVTLPDSLIAVGNYAFYNSFYIAELTLPQNLETIGDYAFSMLRYRLTSIEIPDSVTSIGKGAFWYCENLASVKLPSTLTRIESKTFNSTAIRTIELPQTLKTICSQAFCRTKLTSVVIPASTTYIGELAFGYCENLLNLTLNEGLRTIKKDAFFYCRNLSVLNLPKSVRTIEDQAFAYCTSLPNVTLPSKLTVIAPYTFAQCHGLQWVKIPKSVKKIGDKAFIGCKNLEQVKMTFSDEIEVGADVLKDCPKCAPKFTVQPVDTTVSGVGKTATLTCKATGMNINYCWYYMNPDKDPVNNKYSKSSNTTDTYKIAVTEARNGRRMYCKITDFFGNSVNSQVARVFYSEEPIVLVSQPQNVVVSAPNKTATVSVDAEGTDLTYTWYYRTPRYSYSWTRSSVTASSFKVKVTPERNYRQYYCVISDANGNSVTTNTVYVCYA